MHILLLLLTKYAMVIDGRSSQTRISGFSWAETSGLPTLEVYAPPHSNTPTSKPVAPYSVNKGLSDSTYIASALDPLLNYAKDILGAIDYTTVNVIFCGTTALDGLTKNVTADLFQMIETHIKTAGFASNKTEYIAMSTKRIPVYQWIAANLALGYFGTSTSKVPIASVENMFGYVAADAQYDEKLISEFTNVTVSGQTYSVYSKYLDHYGVQSAVLRDAFNLALMNASTTVSSSCFSLNLDEDYGDFSINGFGNFANCLTELEDAVVNSSVTLNVTLPSTVYGFGSFYNLRDVFSLAESGSLTTYDTTGTTVCAKDFATLTTDYSSYGESAYTFCIEFALTHIMINQFIGNTTTLNRVQALNGKKVTWEYGVALNQYFNVSFYEESDNDDGMSLIFSIAFATLGGIVVIVVIVLILKNLCHREAALQLSALNGSNLSFIDEDFDMSSSRRIAQGIDPSNPDDNDGAAPPSNHEGATDYQHAQIKDDEDKIKGKDAPLTQQQEYAAPGTIEEEVFYERGYEP